MCGMLARCRYPEASQEDEKGAESTGVGPFIPTAPLRRYAGMAESITPVSSGIMWRTLLGSQDGGSL